MPDILFKEKINHPVTFDLSSEDEDEDVWPVAERAQQGTGMVVLSSRNETIIPNSRNPHEQPWTQETIHESIRICRERGFVTGAIVAARPLLGSGNDWKVKSAVYWGIVTSLNTFIPGQLYNAYAPITVRWFIPANHMNCSEDKLFPSDLYLIHAALSEEVVTAKMVAQQGLS